MPACLRVCSTLAAVLALALPACRLDATIDVEVDRDGGGQLGVVLQADAELVARAREAGADPLADLAAAGEALSGQGWRVQTVAAPDGSRSVSLSGPFADPHELAARSRELASALAAPEVEPLQPLRLEVGDERLTLTGAAGLQLTDATEELGLRAEDAVRLLREHAAVGYAVRVTFPAEVLETDGTVRGRTVTWDVPPGERVELRAVSERPPAPILPWVLGIAAGLLLVLLVAFALVRRRGRS